MMRGGMCLNEKQRRRKAIRIRIAPVLRRQADKSNSDVLGSYTGTGKDGERPVQDADDL